ncbi:MAG: hypothetical protein ACO25G_03755 [Holophagaceae bacterium]|jgi:hypothetical protein
MSSILDQKQSGAILIEPSRILINQISYPSSLSQIGECIEKALLDIPPHPCRVILDDFIVPSYLIESIEDLPSDSESQSAFFLWRYQQLSAVNSEFKVIAHPLNGKGWILSGMPFSLVETIEETLQSLGFQASSIVPKWCYLANHLFVTTKEEPSCLISLSASEHGRYRGTVIAWNDSLNLFRQWSEEANLQTWSQERIYPTLAYLERTWSRKPKLYIYGSSTPWAISGYQPVFLEEDIFTGSPHVP